MFDSDLLTDQDAHSKPDEAFETWWASMPSLVYAWRKQAAEAAWEASRRAMKDDHSYPQA